MINEIIKLLTSEQRTALMYAMEQGTTMIIEYQSGKFIGVNCSDKPDFKIIERKNSWILGVK